MTLYKDHVTKVNKKYREENTHLATNNNILREALEEMFKYIRDDLGLSVPQSKLDRWEAIINKEPVQLRLF